MAGVLPVDAGWATLGAVSVAGPDASSFLHSQVTNAVEGLAVGDGNLSARVTRTGHLQFAFSLHKTGERSFLLVLERELVPGLIASLDGFLFADDVTMTDVSGDFTWAAIQGPAANEVVGSGDDLEGAVAEIDGGWLLRRSLTGDIGYVIAATDPSVIQPMLDRAATAGFEVLPPGTLGELFEILRIEAGYIRVGPDTPGERGRLLPETGLEQSVVSYTKGCYIGQEVIARVRTYGSVPYALRALLVDGAVDDLPAVGAPVVVDGKSVGSFGSRTWSALAEGVVAYAFLNRSSRTPGTKLVFEGTAGPVDATVAVLPLYRAADHAARVEALYDRAIRSFAAGAQDAALQLVEQALVLDPAFADGYEAVGVMLGRRGLYHEAIDFFRRLEEVAPDEPMVNTNLSLYYMKLGDRATAEAQSAKALQKSMGRGRGGGDRSAADVAQAQEAGRRKDAARKKEMFAMVLEIDPVDPIALFGMGRALSDLGDWEEAAEFLARAIEVQGNNSAMYLARGKALERLERHQDAVDVYRQGIEVASRRGDLMPLKEMEHRVLLLGVDPNGGPHVGQG